MRRPSSVVIAFAAMMLSGTSAFAAGIFFQTEPRAATTICPAPCFTVQVFAQDDSPGGTRVIQAIQFDVNVVNAYGTGPGQTISDVVVANLPVPPAANTNAGVGNVTITDNTDPESPSQVVMPFELSATVAKSRNEGQDVLVVVSSAFPTSVAELLAARHVGDPNFICTLANACTTQLNGLNANRIYLGFFRMSGVNADTAFIYSNATGNGELVTGTAGLAGLNANGSFSFIAEGSAGCRLGGATGCLADRLSNSDYEYVPTPTPAEPTSVLLVGAALIGLSLIRRRA
jgi:hypothetical protein